jgi:NitT/TauT family transport system substrate-binding protein
MRNIIKVGIVGLLLGAMTGCTAAPTNTTNNSGSPAALTDVTVGIVPFSPDAILFYAMDSGIFKKHGLNVTTQPAASPIEVSAAMLSGTQQFGFITAPVLLNAAIAGTRMKCVAPVSGEIPKGDKGAALVSSKASGITTVQQFANKKIAVVQLGSINRLSLQKTFADAGVTGVQFVAIPFPQMPQALADGRVDGAEIVTPFLTTATAAGANLIQWNPDAHLWPNGTIYCFAATSDYLAKNAKVATAFQAAMKESILYAKGHEQEVLKSLVEHLKLSPEVAAKQELATNFVPEINADSIGSIQADMKQQGWIKTTVPVGDLVWNGK